MTEQDYLKGQRSCILHNNKFCDEFSNFYFNGNIEIYNRRLLDSPKIISDNETKKLLLSELPSEKWFNLQRDYYNTLSDKERKYINLYTYKGDFILNNFIRNNFRINENIKTFIRDNYYFFDYIINDFDYLEDFLIDFYTILNETIKNAPQLDTNIIVYRGQKSYQKGLRHKGMCSTSFNTSVAIFFSIDNETQECNYISKIILPKGTNCLYMSKMNLEMEILLPDNIEFNLITDFKEQSYYMDDSHFLSSNKYIKNIFTNEMELKKYNDTYIDIIVKITKIIDISFSEKLIDELINLYNEIYYDLQDEIDQNLLTLENIINIYRKLIKEGVYMNVYEYKTNISEDLEGQNFDLKN